MSRNYRKRFLCPYSAAYGSYTVVPTGPTIEANIIVQKNPFLDTLYIYYFCLSKIKELHIFIYKDAFKFNK